MQIYIPNINRIYLELMPHFEDVQVLLDMDDEDLIEAYSEMKFLSYNIIDPEDLGWQEV